MRSIVSLGFFIVNIASLTGCQIYRNNSRNLFESAAPSELSSSSIGSGSFPVMVKTENAQMNCWSQPKDDPLWFVNNNSDYQVHFIDDDSIEVCSEEKKQSLSEIN